MSTWVYALIGVSGLGAILSLILKKFITEELLNKIGSVVNKFFYGIGTVCTLGLAKWKFTKGTWNKVFESYVVILIRTLIMNALDGFIQGLESDNKDTK